jgi:NAD(P)-dependent dehydrogenase (short-subunit alcohol dehydrogenase family)
MTVAIVTGAATGIGLAIAQRFARDGASVVIADIVGAEEAAAAINAKGGRAIGLHTDVSNEDSVAQMLERTLHALDGVDVLVNNAAISASIQLKPFEELTLMEWQQMLGVNTIGAFLCCRAVSPHMRARRHGRIVNITSGTAFKGAPHLLHYVASKGALMSMTRSLARELGPDMITVNAVAPGYTLSEGNLGNAAFLETYRSAAIATRSLPRDAYPEDIVGAVAFLAGPDSAFISGQILAVDGGSVYH